MSDKTVSIDGEMYELPKPFMVSPLKTHWNMKEPIPYRALVDRFLIEDNN